MLKPGHLTVLGTFCMVVGIVNTPNWLCLVSGAACLYFGITGLIRESKEEKGDEDEHFD